MPPRILVQAWRQRGIVPMVCDHDSIEGSRRVMQAIRAADPSVPRILAEEIKTESGEIVGLFLTEEVKGGLSAEETLDIIAGQDGLALVPHPFSRRRTSVLRRDVLDAVIGRIDIIEGYNGRNRFPGDNHKAVTYARRMKKPISAGSDAHTPIELFKNYVEVEPFQTPREFLASLSRAALYLEQPPSCAVVPFR
ncbi:MAG: PHP-associated domain-containing protein [Methanomicrobiales archaeon]|nr:PHP-associated domain-containing protein [Methanomicrobiales archaeon]